MHKEQAEAIAMVISAKIAATIPDGHAWVFGCVPLDNSGGVIALSNANCAQGFLDLVDYLRQIHINNPEDSDAEIPNTD